MEKICTAQERVELCYRSQSVLNGMKTPFGDSGRACLIPSGVVHGCQDNPSTIHSPASVWRRRRFWPAERSRSSIVSLYTWQKETSTL